MNWIEHQSSALMFVFVASFLLLAVWESRSAARSLKQSTERRWLAHGILFAGSAAVQSVFLRMSPVLVALAAANNPWGLLNQDWMPSPLGFVAAILLLDLVHYATHRLFHSLGLLWRIHEVHHSDRDYDVSVAVRFHPFEVVGTKALYLLAIALAAPPAAAVFLAEVHTTIFNMLVHANVSLPPRVERIARLVFITPDLHRIHHSVDKDDQNSNFGQTFVWWDRLFDTHRASANSDAGVFATGTVVPDGSYGSIAALFTEPFKRRSR
jgi:sterol desaturase/sphingolipid hydroxylase (fatty acid hydroxylase superfamily)